MNKTLTKILALVGGVAILGGAVLGGMQWLAPAQYKPSNWGNSAQTGDNGDKKPDDSTGGDVDGEDIIEVGSFVMSAPTEEDAPAFNLDVAAYADSIPVETAESSVTITAQLSSSVGSVNWSVGFENPESFWVHGNPVTDYVTVTSTGDLTCRVDCLQAFKEPILVTASLADNPNVTATCRADYKEKIKDISITLKADVGDTTYDYFYSMYLTQGVAPDFTKSRVKFTRGIGTIPLGDKFEIKTYIKWEDWAYTAIHGLLMNTPEVYRRPDIAAKDWTFVTQHMVEYDEHVEVRYDVPLPVLNTADFLSRLYPIMSDGAGGFNQYVSDFQTLFNYGITTLFGSYSKYFEDDYGDVVRPIYCVKTVITVDGKDFEYERPAVFANERISLQTSGITLDKDNVIF